MTNLTRDKIMALEGRALDKAVAEARGWVYQGNGNWYNSEMVVRKLPRAHSDIAAAWELVAGFTCYEIGKDALGCYCRLGSGPKRFSAATRADTIPTAIARDYLLVKTEGDDAKATA